MYSDTYELRARDHCLSASLLLINDQNMQLSIAVQQGDNGQRSTVDTISDTTGGDWVTKAWKLPSDFVEGQFRVRNS